VIFVVAARSVLADRRAPVAFAGVGFGIALSGVLGLVLRWQQAWWAAAVVAAVLAVAAWDLTASASFLSPGRRSHLFVPLVVSYTLEGVGYIIGGTFLVAAISQRAPGALGAGTWVVVGLAALPSAGLWALLGRSWSRPTLLVMVLAAQAVGIALPAWSGSAAAALVSAVLFGGTFLGVTTVSLGIGGADSAAVLTTAYAAGQIAGPLAVAPLLDGGYGNALLVGSAVVACSAAAAAILLNRSSRLSGSRPDRSGLLRSGE
jgi:hypothetical protein